jgi:hypothetical protein
MEWRNRNGVAILFLVLVGLLVVVVVVGGVSFVAFRNDQKVVPVPEDVCKCSDLTDMESRVNEAAAAAAAFANSMLKQSAADSASRSAAMYNEGSYTSETATAQPAVTAATTPGARTGSGKTGTDCVTKVEAPTECLRAGLQTHENIHSTTCQALKAAGKVGTFGDYKAAMTMVDYWREEVTAYSAEMEYLGRQIARVKADPACKPKTAVKEERYHGAGSKEDQKDRLAAARRRVTNYVSGIF